ncbi:MAG TPA: helix-turn-helix domain-containing protein [Ignavibacteriaceae bacterium]|nr:helix-turn-helix domain-containing protein [Ignavibacteriaceae bacterium]
MKSELKFEFINPSDQLKDYVKHFWFLEGNTSKTLRALADGSPGIIFHQAENGLFLNQTKKLSTIFLYGQTVKPIEMNAEGKFRMVGLHFHPHVMKALFGFHANELTDTCLDLSMYSYASGMNLKEKLINTESVTEQIKTISEYLTGIIKKKKIQVDQSIHFAIHHLISSNGNMELGELRKTLNLSQRTFERKFEQYVGISPRLFARICRFQASLNQLNNKNYLKLSDIAFDNSYSDQPHFIRTFKEFSGHSPSEFQKQSHQVLQNTPVFLKK